MIPSPKALSVSTLSGRLGPLRIGANCFVSELTAESGVNPWVFTVRKSYSCYYCCI